MSLEIGFGSRNLRRLSSAGIAYHSVFGDRRAVVKPAGISLPQLNLQTQIKSVSMKPRSFFFSFFFSYAIIRHKRCLFFDHDKSMLEHLLLQPVTLSTCNFSLPAAACPHRAASMRSTACIHHTDRD